MTTKRTLEEMAREFLEFGISTLEFGGVDVEDSIPTLISLLEQARREGAACVALDRAEAAEARVKDLEGEREDWLVEDGLFHIVETQRDEAEARVKELEAKLAEAQTEVRKVNP